MRFVAGIEMRLRRLLGRERARLGADLPPAPLLVGEVDDHRDLCLVRIGGQAGKGVDDARRIVPIHGHFGPVVVVDRRARTVERAGDDLVRRGADEFRVIEVERTHAAGVDHHAAVISGQGHGAGRAGRQKRHKARNAGEPNAREEGKGRAPCHGYIGSSRETRPGLFGCAASRARRRAGGNAQTSASFATGTSWPAWNLLFHCALQRMIGASIRA